MNSRKARLTGVILLQTIVWGSATSFAQVSDPTVNIASGPSTSPQTAIVTVSDTTYGATIYYTTDRSTPTTSSATIASGNTLLISQNATLSIQAYLNGTASNLVVSKYTNAGMTSAGVRHTLILKSDGTVWATGDNTNGELGNGLTTNSSYPVQVLTGSSTPLTGIVTISAGKDESFAVDSSGNVWAWGFNTNGQLGLGTSTNALYATQISSGTLSNIVGIASAQYHTVAVKADGSAWGWGADTSGQVGNGSTGAWVTTPTQVLAPSGFTGNLGGIVAVAAGANHSLALDNTGKVWAWGDDTYGQLGDADTTLTAHSLPVSVLQSGVALTNVIGLAANATDSFALRNDGSTWAWGDNSIGELGLGTTTASLSAVQVASLTTSMTAVTSEAAVDPNGNVWTWGDNTNGELGIGSTGAYATLPLAVTTEGLSAPTLTLTAGSGQYVTDGTFSMPFTITATSGGTGIPNAWVNFIVNPANGLLGLNTSGTQLSPIIGGFTNSSGQISFYLQAPTNGTGTVSLTSTSGTSLISLSAMEQLMISSDTPTMPQWALIVMAVLLVWAASRRKTRLTG